MSGSVKHQRHRAKRGDAGVSDDGAEGERGWCVVKHCTPTITFNKRNEYSK
jgi:hypothetical protein